MSQSLAIKNSRLSLTTVSDRTSPFGLIVAVLLHVGIIAATLFSFTHKLDIADESPPVVPVDLVTIGKKTDLMAMVKIHVKAPPKEELQQAPPTPTPPPVATPQTKPEDLPDTAPSSPQIAKAEPAPIPKIKPEPVKPAPPQKQKWDIDKLAALLDKQLPAPSSVKNAKKGAQNIKGFGAQDAETVELADALRSQIQPCWSPPVGAPHAEDLIVDFDLFLNKDGSVAGMPQLTGDSLQTAASNSYTRAAADAARRAIYQCQPFKLPADQYGKWHEINPFHFDPSQWMGQ